MRVQFASLKQLRICTIRKSIKRFDKSKLLENLELPHHGGCMKKEKQLSKAAVIRQLDFSTRVINNYHGQVSF